MNRRTTTFAIAIALALGATALTACSSDKAATSSSTPAAATTPVGGAPAVTAGTEGVAPTVPGATTPAPTGAVLTIKDFAFSALSVKAGEAINIVNADGANHTVSADDGSFVVKIDAGANSNLVIPVAGTYKIHCDIHKSMTSTIVVS